MSRAVLEYSPMTNTTTGMPTRRARTLFSRIFDAATNKALKQASSDDPQLPARVVEQLEAAYDTLERTARWHQALFGAHQSLAVQEQFLVDAAEKLVVAAWDAAAREPAPSDPTALRLEADRMIATMRARTGDFTAHAVERLLGGPRAGGSAGPADLIEVLDEAWESAHIEPQPMTDNGRRELDDLLLRFSEAIVPLPSESPAEKRLSEARAQSLWEGIVADRRIDDLVTDVSLSLVKESPRRKPALREAEQEGIADDDELIRPSYPLDHSIQYRIGRILKNAPNPFTGLTAWNAVAIAARASAQPYGLAGGAARAALIFGRLAYSGVSADPDDEFRGPNRLVGRVARGAIGELSARWASHQRVREHLANIRRNAGYRELRAPMTAHLHDPLPYLLGRLWQRLSRTDFDRHEPSNAFDAWAHVKGALTSAGKNIPRQIASIEKLPFARMRLIDAQGTAASTGRTPESVIDAAMAKEAAARFDEDSDGIDLELGKWQLRHGRLPASAGFRRVIDTALSVSGAVEVEAFLTGVARGTAQPGALERLEATWLRWCRSAAVHSVARRDRYRVRGATAPNEEAERIEHELGLLASFGQARAQILGRLAITAATDRGATMRDLTPADTTGTVEVEDEQL
jgi:hypothetical protein